MLSADEQRQLLSLARHTLERYLIDGALLVSPPPELALSPGLMLPQGAFVSLHHRGRLRGCVGFSDPIKPLAHAVIESAVSAAVRDLRFPPVSASELPEILIEISVISALAALSPSEVVIGVHGLVIERGEQRGILLPQVATEHRWDRESFLRQLCFKAGLPDDAWKTSDARVLGFTAQVFSETAIFELPPREGELEQREG